MTRKKEDIIDIEEGKVRRHFDEKMGENYYSIVDIIAILTKSTNARNYWKVQKNRLKNTHPELVTECNQLKMKANDGKSYLTDTANKNTLLKIIELISPANIDVFQRWFKKTENSLSTVINESPLSYLSFDEEIIGELMVDAYQTEKEIVVQAMIAGISSENISISSTRDTLTIKGKHELPKNILREDYLLKELNRVPFSRIISLPEEVDIDEITTTENRGLLIIKLPKLNKERNKIIKIKSL